jgi:hypothetical protein
MSQYSDHVDAQYLERLQQKIADFAEKCKRGATENRTTIILFPGGFASQLVRATTADDADPPFDYDLLWLGGDFICGGVSELQLVAGDDTDSRYILPDGYIGFFDFGPYSGFADWCEAAGFDLFVFGWDWRRSGVAAADFFLNKFMPAFERGVADCNPSPLDNLWLVGHSFGGIIAKHVLNQPDNPYVKRLKGAITVGTPFYGYGGQLHRFLVGDPDLNLIGGGAGAVTRIGSTLPASYELLFLDSAAYDANAEAFKTDAYALTAYPCMDQNAAGQRADPYNPEPGKPATPPGPNDSVRYLPGYDFSWDLLAAGRAAANAVSAPLAPSVKDKLWNIRGVQTRNHNPIDETVVAHQWRRVPANYVPDPHHNPVDDQFGPGDGVIPAWSARLLGNPKVVNIVEDGVEHMVLMNHKTVQEEIAHILAPAESHDAIVAVATMTSMRTAVRDELERFLGHVVDLGEELTAAARRLHIVRIAGQISGPDEEKPLQRLHARAFIDALKSPNQKLKRIGVP